MSEFVLLYRDSVEARQQRMGSPDRAQQEMKKWQAWFKDMTDKGQLKTLGQPLDLVGKVIEGKRRTITDGPFSETKDRRLAPAATKNPRQSSLSAIRSQFPHES